MRPTIKDVAVECGYSAATVSLVLNGKSERIAETTKAKIIETAERMNYRPNRLAVSLITKRTNIIGLVLSDLNNMFFTTLAHAIEEECKKYGYLIFYVSSSDLEPRDTEYIRTLIDHGVDGIIYAKDPTDKEQEAVYTKLINQANIPVVTIDAPMDVSRTTTILLDQVKGARIAVEHLIAYGHKRIGCLAGPFNIVTSKERLIGYRDAIVDAGLEYDEELIYEGDFRMGSGTDALPYLLGKGATAIFAFNDVMAHGLYRTAIRFNLRIPRDLSIVGFDDNPINEVLEVPLTSVYQPIDNMGKAAAQEILKMIEDPSPHRERVIFEPQLKVRASTIRLGNKE